MRVAVVFDTPYSGWEHAEHEAQMEREVAAWKVDEPEMEYQIAHALRERGHEVRLLGIRDDLQYLVRCLSEWGPDLVFNGAEAFRGNAALEYVLPALLEAEGYRYTGAPPLGLQVTRNKAISKKVLAYFGIHVPGFVSYRLHEKVDTAPDLRFPVVREAAFRLMALPASPKPLSYRTSPPSPSVLPSFRSGSARVRSPKSSSMAVSCMSACSGTTIRSRSCR